MGFGDRPSMGTIVDYGSPEAMEADLATAEEASTANVGASLDAEEAEGALPSKSLDITLDGAPSTYGCGARRRGPTEASAGSAARLWRST